MAKSTRSKVKRSFRAKKREEGAYAVTEAAQVHRLHQKLKRIVAEDVEGDVSLDDAPADEKIEEGGGYWLPFWLGLLDHEDLSAEMLERVGKIRRVGNVGVVTGDMA